MSEFNLTYKPYGNSAILIEWPARIDSEIIQDIKQFEQRIRKDMYVLDTIIAYNSLLVKYRYQSNYPEKYSPLTRFPKKVELLKEMYVNKDENEVVSTKVWNIPVCYNAQFGVDLHEIAQEKNLSIKEIVKLHTEPKYLIYFIGFQPGFLYLGGLNPKIHTPRRANPRLRVEKGMVAIGGEQTGVYPQDSSGGWNIIGKSPIDFFDATKEQPCFAKAGDFIQFVAVDLETFKQISTEVKRGSYELKYDEL